VRHHPSVPRCGLGAPVRNPRPRSPGRTARVGRSGRIPPVDRHGRAGGAVRRGAVGGVRCRPRARIRGRRGRRSDLAVRRPGHVPARHRSAAAPARRRALRSGGDDRGARRERAGHRPLRERGVRRGRERHRQARRQRELCDHGRPDASRAAPI
ncbi:MAG: Histone acetyltransferase HPA2 and related acetyltransferases, partial [uncultured Thermomicrobiales bacterium]